MISKFNMCLICIRIRTDKPLIWRRRFQRVKVYFRKELSRLWAFLHEDMNDPGPHTTTEQESSQSRNGYLENSPPAYPGSEDAPRLS